MFLISDIVINTPSKKIYIFNRLFLIIEYHFTHNNSRIFNEILTTLVLF